MLELLQWSQKQQIYTWPSKGHSCPIVWMRFVVSNYTFQQFPIKNVQPLYSSWISDMHRKHRLQWTFFVSIDLVVFLLEKKNEIWQAYRQRQTLRHDNTVSGGRCGHERVIVGFTTTYVISAYKHWCYEFEFHSGRSVHHYVIKFVSDLRQVGGFLQFPPPIKQTAMI